MATHGHGARRAAAANEPAAPCEGERAGTWPPAAPGRRSPGPGSRAPARSTSPVASRAPPTATAEPAPRPRRPARAARRGLTAATRERPRPALPRRDAEVIRMMLPKYIWMFAAKLTSKPWGSSRCWLDFVLASPQAHPQNLQFITERPYRLLEGGDSEDREASAYLAPPERPSWFSSSSVLLTSPALSAAGSVPHHSSPQAWHLLDRYLRHEPGAGSVPVMPIFTREETEARRRRVHGIRGERTRTCTRSARRRSFCGEVMLFGFRWCLLPLHPASQNHWLQP
ncbi:uncharacterized protein LOC118674786 [Myotis myotis]|uniref:uncharacterized protein LOC118674786 n=1 Tax=Myotis myotis TaxID=51298 RepID=UPI00174E42D9|nr:uncharacterized protein LOC118674786 [Myotis myotis]